MMSNITTTQGLFVPRRNMQKKSHGWLKSALVVFIIPYAAWAGTPKEHAATPPKAENLGTIQITGSQLQMLQNIKAALNRNFSLHAADRNKLVCRIQSPTGSRLEKVLFCGTNHDWIKRQEETQIMWNEVTRALGPRSSMASKIQALQSIRGRNVAFELPLNNPAEFKKLLNLLPAPRSAADNDTSAGDGNAN